MLQELDRAVLTIDLPDHGLSRGDIGTVVLLHNGGEGYEVEFMTLTGETLSVVSLSAFQVRPIAPREIANARPVKKVKDDGEDNRFRNWTPPSIKFPSLFSANTTAPKIGVPSRLLPDRNRILAARH